MCNLILHLESIVNHESRQRQKYKYCCITQEETHIGQSSYQCFLFFEARLAEEVSQLLPDIKKMST